LKSSVSIQKSAHPPNVTGRVIHPRGDTRIPGMTPWTGAFIDRIVALERPIVSYVREYRILSLLSPSINTLVRRISPSIVLTTRGNRPGG